MTATATVDMQAIEQLRDAIETADAIVVGAGAGLSTSAGLTYAGERFERLFGDFIAKYGIRDMELLQIAVSKLNAKNSMVQEPAPWIISGKAARE